MRTLLLCCALLVGIGGTAGESRGPRSFGRGGRLFALEGASEALRSGHTCIGVRCRDGVVLMVVKAKASGPDPALTRGAGGDALNGRVVQLPGGMAMLAAGRAADAQVLAQSSRLLAEASSADAFDGAAERLQRLADRLTVRFHEASVGDTQRPLPAAVFLTDGGTLLFVDPWGTARRFDVACCGAASDGVLQRVREGDWLQRGCEESLEMLAALAGEAVQEAAGLPGGGGADEDEGGADAPPAEELCLESAGVLTRPRP